MENIATPTKDETEERTRVEQNLTPPPAQRKEAGDYETELEHLADDEHGTGADDEHGVGADDEHGVGAHAKAKMKVRGKSPRKKY